MKKLHSAFTLIELLVVIAIIAILAAILFPVFARARENARRASCQSNMKQMGLGVMQYIQDYDDKYPQAYWYKNDNSGDGGYVQWSYMLQPYVKSTQLFVCPSDPSGGLRPTNGSTMDRTGTDDQVPRLSYTANSTIMPRKRRSADAPSVVSSAAVEETARVIMIAEYPNTVQCLNGTSDASGTNLKSHRSANAFMSSASGGQWSGEYANGATLPTSVYAVSAGVAKQSIDACKTTAATTYPHITYVGADRHLDGSNFAFADGHVKWHKLEQTLSPTNFLWGTRYYPINNIPVLDAAGNQVR